MNPVSFSNVPALASEAKPNPRLESAAHEFEASLMKEFLKPLEKDSLFSDDDSSTGSADTLMGYGAEAMAKGISEHGGFGIATQILEHFKTSENADENSHRIGGGQPL
jgi:flagellar protein FlgJ